MRMQYTYKEEHMPIWDHELGGLPRAPDQGGSAFILGIIGAGQVGKRILDNVLRSGAFEASQVHVSTRGPERLGSYEKLGVSCVYDDAAVAQRADLLVLACLPSQIQQVAKALRGNVRGTTLVLSIVAGFSAERMAALLRVSPGQLVKPLLGGESGLPIPDDLTAAATPAKAAAAGEQPQQQAAADKPGKRSTLANSVSRAEAALERRRAAEILRRQHLRLHVMTAFRASLADDTARRRYACAIADALRPLGMPDAPLLTISRTSLTGEVPELKIWGEHCAQPQLKVRQHVLVLPGGADLDTRDGHVEMRIDDERQEYVVKIGDAPHRYKRCRLVPYHGDLAPLAEAGAAAAAALASRGNAADTAEEGFMVDGAEVADVDGAEALAQVEAFFKLIGERAVGAREEPVSMMSEKSGGFEPKGKKAAQAKPMLIAPEGRDASRC